MNYYKAKEGKEFDTEVKTYFGNRPLWLEVVKQINELLGEELTEIADNKDNLYINIADIKQEKNRTLFTKQGELKETKTEFLEKYKSIIKDVGLEDSKQINMTLFEYGIYQKKAEQLWDSFVTKDYEFYFATDIDMFAPTEEEMLLTEDKRDGIIELITKEAYEEARKTIIN